MTKNQEKNFLVFLDRLFDRDVYFHGSKFMNYLLNDAISRFLNWLGEGLCFEMSTMAMLLLRDYPSAKLCRDVYLENGKYVCRHSWVEFTMPGNGLFAVDFSWYNRGFVWLLNADPSLETRNVEDLKNDVVWTTDGKFIQLDEGMVLKKCWECSYQDFWNYPIVVDLAIATSRPRTSHVLRSLAAMTPHPNKGLEPQYTKDMFGDGTVMPPFMSMGGKPITNSIIRDFLKHPKRKQPSGRTFRRANSLIRKFTSFKTQNSLA